MNGAALGGGTGLLASADFAFALSHAKYGLPSLAALPLLRFWLEELLTQGRLGFTEVKLGLIPAVISPFLMRKIGLGNCSRFFATG